MNNDMDVNQQCPICFEDIKKYGFCVTNCSHVFCMDCMVESLKEKRACPLCRDNMDPEIISVNDTSDYRFGYQIGSEEGFEEGVEVGIENAQKIFDEQRREWIRRNLKLKDDCNKAKSELELTLLQFNTSINFKNSFQVKSKKCEIIRTRSLD